MKKSSSPFIIQALAIFTILGILTTVAISLWVTYRLDIPLGPIAVAHSPNQTIYIATGKRLFVLNSQGKFLEQIFFEELGPFERVTDILASTDTDNKLFITDVGLGTVFCCDLTTKHCQPALFKEGKSIDIYFDAIGFVQAPNNGEMYVADISQHFIDRYDSNGHYQETKYRAETELFYPNDLWSSQAGFLVVSDTDHHRLVAFDIEKYNFHQPVWEFSVLSDFKQKSRVWPIALAQAATKNWWVVNGDDIFYNNDVVVFDPDGNALRRIPLASNEPEPISLAPTQEAMIIIDQRHLQVLAVPYDENQAIFNLGDSTFQTILGTLQTEHRSWLKLRQAAWGALAIFVFFAIILVYLEQRYQNQQSLPKQAINQALPSNQMPTEVDLLMEKSKIHWIYPNKILILGKFLLISALLFLGVPMLIGDTFSMTVVEMFIPNEKYLIAGTVIPVWLMALYFTYISTQTAIGTDGDYIWLSDHRRRIFKGLPTHVFYSEEVLMLHGMMIQFKGEFYLPLISFN